MELCEQASASERMQCTGPLIRLWFPRAKGHKGPLVSPSEPVRVRSTYGLAKMNGVNIHTGQINVCKCVWFEPRLKIESGSAGDRLFPSDMTLLVKVEAGEL